MTHQVTNKRNTIDPAAAAREATMALAVEKQRNAYLDRILAEEKLRNQASENITGIWNEMRKAGLDIAEARKALVWRSCAVEPQ